MLSASSRHGTAGGAPRPPTRGLRRRRNAVHQRTMSSATSVSARRSVRIARIAPARSSSTCTTRTSGAGAALPEATECPDLAGAHPCSGRCGECPGESYCHGRSPLHPTGICLRSDNWACGRGFGPCTDPGQACFVYRVEPEAQAIADDWGLCFPVEQCRALAARLPGGGRCDETPVDGGDGG
jgi:hypothetical protein